jgi:serine/threonine-protein kinase
MAEELARVSRGQSASADTQQATRVIAAGEATRVIGRPPEGATSVMRPAAPPPPPERPAPRRSAWPWVLVLVLLILAAVAGFVVYTMLSGNDKTVPDTVIGQTCKQAIQTLKADGLRGKCVNVQSDFALQDKIVSTDPAVGSGVSSGALITLHKGIGPNTVKVPKVKGLSLLAAQSALQGAHLVAGTPVAVDSPKAAQNVVIGSTPKEGTPAKPGSSVILRIASGFVNVPSVTGDSCDEAKKALQKVTLNANCQNRPNQADQGTAFATSLGGVNRVAQHTNVTVFISSGQPEAPLPNVVGQTSGDAKRALRSAGFKVKVTQEVECADQSKDNIVQAEDPSGPTAPRGSFVSITVAKFRPNDPSCGGPPST